MTIQYFLRLLRLMPLIIPLLAARVAAYDAEKATPQIIAYNLRTYSESLQIQLMELGGKDLAVKLKPLTPDADGINSSIKEKDLFALFVSRTKASVNASAQQSVLIDSAAAAAAEFLSVNSAPIIEDLPPYAAEYPKAEADLVPLSAAQLVDLRDVIWNGVDAYVTQRMAALCPVLDALEKGDRVVLTNLPAASAAALLPDIKETDKLNLPLIRYQKSIELIRHKDGTASLIIADFRSRAYLTHFMLMVQKYLLDKNQAEISVYRADSAALYEPGYAELKKFITDNAQNFRHTTALVIGYPAAFAENWSKYAAGSIKPQKETWGADFYEIPDLGRVAVLSGDAGTHGESLGRQIGAALEILPDVRMVFFGGSGGALRTMHPYGLFFPDGVLASDGTAVPNVLSDGTQGGLHAGVDSPLEETPQLLKAMSQRGAASIDMEVRGLAEAVRNAGAKLGAAILITDFPVPRKVFGSVELGFQDFQAKRAARSAFANAVYDYLTKGVPAFGHKVEKLAGKTVARMSAENMAAYRKKIGPLDKNEKRIATLLGKMDFGPVMRMTPKRLHWFAADETLLSHRQAVLLRASSAAPVTPELEDDVYGAYDYIFVSFEPGNGRETYGSSAIKLKPEILARTWGTAFSAWYYSDIIERGNPGISKSELTAKTREMFVHYVLHPSDYKEAAILGVIDYLRNTPQEIRQKLFSARDGPALWKEIEPLYIARLELKLKDFLDLDEIDSVLTGADVYPSLIKMLENKGVPTHPIDGK